MKINLIVAVDAKNGIGKNNMLPWHLPADLKYFKSVTSGYPIIMGRKTYDSIGRVLPNRKNIIISRQVGLEVPGAIITDSLEKSFELCKTEEQVFVIGGSQIFQLSLPLADMIYLTLIHHNFDTDVFFPEIDRSEWIEEDIIRNEPDEKNLYPYSFIRYKRT